MLAPTFIQRLLKWIANHSSSSISTYHLLVQNLLLLLPSTLPWHPFSFQHLFTIFLLTWDIMSQMLILILIPWLLTTPCPIVPLLYLHHLSCQLSRPIQFFWRPIPSYTCIRTSHSILVLQQTLSVTARTCSNCLLILNGQYIHFCRYFISYEQMF